MNLHWIDWAIVAFLLGSVLALTIYSKRYVRGVADFLAANRLGGRYLLTVSCGVVGGAVSIVAFWEMIYNSGLPTQWWVMMNIPLALFMALTGFVVYRYRQTRALTLAQFFEERYSRRFRFFAGTLCWISGIFNFGIFPAISAKFIIYYFGFPLHFEVLGMTVSTFPTVMIAYLSLSVYIACAGGQISIMLTDFYQGIITMIAIVAVMLFLLWSFNWNDISAGLLLAPEGKSMINPFKTGRADFSIWYFLIGLLSSVYATMAWQGSSGYNAAARNPHEARMAGIISRWREFAGQLCMLLIPLSAYAVLHLNTPQFLEMAAPINAELAKIADPMLRGQMVVPIFLAHILPVGLVGLFAAVILAAAISCDDTYVHAWGSIFIQDVVTPLRGRPFTAKTHLLILRLAIIGVAVFGFCFSMLFPIKDFIYMFFALTGAIYLGGAGSVLIGGLYWKRGTTEAAWVALSVGSVLAFGGMMLQVKWDWIAPQLLQAWPGWDWVASTKILIDDQLTYKFPINGQFIYFIAMAVSVSSYVLISLLGPRRIHNMDKLLHRGQYAVQEDLAMGDARVQELVAHRSKWSLSRFLGITTEFTWFDRFITRATFFWSMGWWGLFMVGTAVCVLKPNLITDAHWCTFWWIKIVLFAGTLCVVVVLWLTIGGLRDAFHLFRDLRGERVDEHDDGFVPAPDQQDAEPKP